MKAFTKTVEEGRFPFVILDAPNIQVEDFRPFYMAAQVKPQPKVPLLHCALAVNSIELSPLTPKTQASLYALGSDTHVIVQRVGYDVYVLKPLETDPEVVSLAYANDKPYFLTLIEEGKPNCMHLLTRMSAVNCPPIVGAAARQVKLAECRMLRRQLKSRLWSCRFASRGTCINGTRTSFLTWQRCMNRPQTYTPRYL